VPDDSLVRHADFREQGGQDAMVALLEQPERPDAVFVANNLMTIGAMECLVSGGVNVPGEMGVVGFDDIPWAHLVRPSLTTVAQPTYDMGRTAGLLLAERSAAPDRPASTVVLRTSLHVRSSSRR
jgi:LacI family transcriptional regulator